MQNNEPTLDVAQYSTRLAELHPLPLAKGVVILHPERALISFDGMSKDIGAICYLQRQDLLAKSNRRTREARKVDLSSFCKDRAALIARFIVFFSDLLETGGRTNSTVHSWVGLWINLMDWADQNGHCNIFNGGDETYAGFRQYVKYMRQRVDTNEISLKTGAQRQFSMLRLMERFTGMYDIHRGVRLLDNVTASGGMKTTPPSEHDLGRFEGLCDAVFTSHCDLVLENRPFPFKMPVPKSLEWDQECLWLFPMKTWCMNPARVASQSAEFRPFAAYDFGNGRILTLEELKVRFPDYVNKHHAISSALKRLRDANTDVRHLSRVDAAVRAHSAFLCLFLGQTGMNFSVAFSLPWGSEYKVGTSQQGFREIKWRAGGKIVSVVLRSRFLPLFSRFVELRKYLLNGQKCDSLFFSLGSHRKEVPKAINSKNYESFLITLSTISPDVPAIRNRKLRAAKQDFHIRNDDPAISAKIMGHSEETARRHYSAGSESLHRDEMTEFISKVQSAAVNKHAVIPPGELVPNGVKGHLGTCTGHKTPNAIADGVPIEPDCSRQEGCLFCDKHRVHADATDVRKLVSCSFVVQQTTYLPGAQAYFAPVLERIFSLLEEVSSIPGLASVVREVTLEVEEYGDLDPYWAEKWALLCDLEIVV